MAGHVSVCVYCVLCDNLKGQWPLYCDLLPNCGFDVNTERKVGMLKNGFPFQHYVVAPPLEQMFRVLVLLISNCYFRVIT